MIPYGHHHIDEDDIQAVVDQLRSGWLTQGPTVAAFENAVKDYVGAKYAVAVSSGTAGLHIAALAAGVGPGTAVVTSPITFVASSNVAFYCGADPLFADIDATNINMSPEKLATVLSRNANVKAVIPVHFGGLPCDMVAIRQLADRGGVRIIEDAAHALGATYEDGGKVGNCAHSDMTVFSFHPVKAIAAGEGGLITTNDDALYHRLLRLRSHGINKLDDPLEMPEQSGPWYYEMQELGYNYRITDLQCALALSQFNKLDKFVARRRELAFAYDTAFAQMTHCRPAQPERRDQSGLHLYVLRIDFDAIGMSRADLMLTLRERGIGTQVHYIPVPAQPFYRKYQFRPEDYHAANSYYAEALSIPLFYDLTDAQQQGLIATFAELVG